MQPAFIIVIRFRLKAPKQRVQGGFYLGLESVLTLNSTTPNTKY